MLPKIARTTIAVGALAIGSLAVAAPAQAASPVPAPAAEAATVTPQAWPTWGIYSNLANCVAEGVSLKSAGVLRDFICVPATIFTGPSYPHALLGLVN
ncbi:hypothetical protein ACGF5C_12730 [Micromonospora sp. NPDC047620]|uniref:hypothetical protein n=1 Tax=Micromonospora sp. NPDC047620 TaxID=3364251 RepID=UPI003721C50F